MQSLLNLVSMGQESDQVMDLDIFLNQEASEMSPSRRDDFPEKTPDQTVSLLSIYKFLRNSELRADG